MKFRELLKGLDVREVRGDLDREVRGIAVNSSEVEADFLFVAIRGFKTDGHQFIGPAVERGARFLLVEHPREGLGGVPQAVVPNTRQALGPLASHFYGAPSRKMRLVGVTGTNGKTSTVYLVESILRAAGRVPGVIGTVNYRYADRTLPAPNTTPEANALQRLLAEMRAAGVTDVVMEVSSHALELGRVLGVSFDVGVFTNLSQDHLDFHLSMEAYLKAKARLFSEVLPQSAKSSRWAVLNADDPASDRLGVGRGIETVRYGLGERARVRARRIRLGPDGFDARIELGGLRGSFALHSPLLGEHNVHNVLAAAAVGRCLGIPARVIRKGLEEAPPIPGRLQRVPNPRGIHLFVDYAHTPDALDQVLRSVRPLTPGRLIVVFGCGGDRDRSKRPLMGKAVVAHADLVFITSDNPRTEDPTKIIQEIEGGMNGARKLTLQDMLQSSSVPVRGYTVIEDRRTAIRMAVETARKGDLVVLAGKGHEDHQIVGSRRLRFSDAEEARKVFEPKAPEAAIPPGRPPRGGGARARGPAVRLRSTPGLTPPPPPTAPARSGRTLSLRSGRRKKKGA